MQRLIDSWHLPAGVTEYYQWMNLPDGDTGFDLFGRPVVIERGAAWHTIETQWPQIAADLDNGTPAALGVVTVASASPADLGANHQVLAYGYAASASQVTVRVYDPNSGRNDGIYIRFDPRAPTKPTAFAHNLNIAPRSGASSAPPTPRPRRPAPDPSAPPRQPHPTPGIRPRSSQSSRMRPLPQLPLQATH